MSWRVHRATGTASALHSRAVPDPVGRAVHVLDVDRPALVLGSTQADDVVDRAACRAAGVEVVRRRSGGGAVLLDPGDVVWVDVELPRRDDLWHDDVNRATWWLGECWADALGGGLAVHRGGLEVRTWGALVCFAGLGPGEVTDGAGAKVVGLSQRRTRGGARFQCAVPLAWSPARLAALLALDDERRAALVADLEHLAAPVRASPADVVDALLDRLP